MPGALVFLLHDTYGFPAGSDRRHRARARAHGRHGRATSARWRRSASARAPPAASASISAAARRSLSRSEFRGYEELQCAGPRGGAAEQMAPASSRLSTASRAKWCSIARPSMPSPAGRSAIPASSPRRRTPDSWSRTRRSAARRMRTSASCSAARSNSATCLRRSVDAERRQAIRLNHSATHLLHAALRKVLGTHVQQKGSLVAPDRLRFDFSHFQPVTPEELQRIEQLVNAQIRANNEAARRASWTTTRPSPAAPWRCSARSTTSDVRVLRFGEFSTELCGGTHVAARRRHRPVQDRQRIAASPPACGASRPSPARARSIMSSRVDGLLDDVAQLVHGSRDEAASKVREALERIRALEKENRALKDKLATGSGTRSGRRGGRCRRR